MATAKIIELDETNTCKLCDNALAKYTCPRCELLYCSLECFRCSAHLDCAESFYKDNVLEELRLDDKEGSEAKMMEILRRMHEQNRNDEAETEESDGYESIDSDDDPDHEDITTRLAGVDLDNAEEVWDKLTEDEKQEFVAFLKSEDVSKLIKSWEPWWTYYNEDKVQDSSISQAFKENCPKMPPIKDLSSITKKKPSACVKFNMINILASYVFTARYFNGEHMDFSKEAVSCMTSLSLVLKSAENFNDYETAVKSVEHECTNTDWIINDKENIETMWTDLEMILRGPNNFEKNYYVMCALSDVHSLLNNALTPVEANTGNFQKSFPKDSFPDIKLESPDKIKALIKKLEYYLSYAKDCYSN